jgi:hypothetical protein
MSFSHRISARFALAALALVAGLTTARAQEPVAPPAAVAAVAAPEAGASGAPAEVEQLKIEVERLRLVVERQERALGELERRMGSSASAQASDGTASAPSGGTAPSPAAAPARREDEALKKQVDELSRRWGKLRLSGDVSVRAESFFNQGFDAPADLGARNRFRLRARVQLASEITKNFDWGIRLASGSFDNPVSPQQSFTDYYDRKPFAIDRAYIHYDSKTERANFEAYGGKFEVPWKRTSVTFDEDVQVEGFTERLRVGVSKDGVLRSVAVTAWQLPYRERSIGVDAVLYGGQVLTEWKWSENWASTVTGAFHTFEQVNLIPPALNVSPTLVNAGFDYGTTNTVVINPFTNLPEYRSEFRVIDMIAEIRYAGFGEKTNDVPRWPIVLRADWVHNTSAFNNQRDGGTLEFEIGRTREQNDLAFNYLFWKTEREIFPSVFMDSEMIIQTNSVSHAVRGAYMLNKQVQLNARYLLHRRLQTVLPVNRWQNHVQVDMIYRF